MPREFPKFLFSDPKNTKSPGPFVIHAMHPMFICKVLDFPDTNNNRLNLFNEKEGLGLAVLNGNGALYHEQQSLKEDIQAALEWLIAQKQAGFIKV